VVPYEEKEFFGAEGAIPYHINYELPVMFIPFLHPCLIRVDVFIG